MNLRRLFRCAGTATPTPTPTPAVLFPPQLPLPTANKTISPSTADAGTGGSITSNGFSTVGGGAVYGDVIELTDGAYNPYLRGPASDAGSYYLFAPSSPGTLSGNPIIIRPRNHGQATIGCIATGFTDVAVEWQEITFTDALGYTPTIISTYGGGDPHLKYNYRPTLYFQNGSGTNPPVFRSCKFLGNPLASIGDDTPNNGAVNGGSFYSCLIQGGRNFASGWFGTVDSCYFRDMWDLQLGFEAGRGSIIQDTIFFRPAGHALNGWNLGDAGDGNTSPSHVDYIQFRTVSQSRTGADIVRRNVMAKGATDSSLMAVAIQDTNGATSFTVANRQVYNNLIVNGQVDDCVGRQLRASSYSRNTITTDLLPNVQVGAPGIQLVGCSGLTIDRNIVENAIDVDNSSAANSVGVNTWTNTIFIGRSLGQGQTDSLAFTPTGASAQTRYSPYDVFADPAYGANAYAGIDVNDPAAVKQEYRRRFRPKLNGPAKLGDGTYAGALFPNGTWNDGTAFAGSQTFAG